jgi:hypothetical protein
MSMNDDSLGQSGRKAMRELFAERAKHPQVEPDEQTRRIVREIIAEFSRFGPKQVAAVAEQRHHVQLDPDMVRGALAELEKE